MTIAEHPVREFHTLRDVRRGVADAVLAEGLATEEEVRETIAELTAFEDPRTTVACPRIFQVRGRKSGALVD